jgi:transposase
MDEFVKQLCKEFDYESHETGPDLVYIYVKSNRAEVKCPYCGATGRRIHSWYERRFRDLPIQGKKVEVVVNNRKYYCPNQECRHTTFAESFDCLPFKGKRSRRLTESIMDISLSMSSVAAAATLRKGTADVSKSTICNLLKKGLSN